MLQTWRLALLLTLLAAGVVAFFFIPPFAQDTAYHNFADQRTLWNVPHALNVLSNLPFVVFGVWGVVYLLRQRGLWRPEPNATSARSLKPWELWTFLVIFVFVALTGVGSMYYHAQPDNATLYWDRLPLTVVFMAFFCLVLADRVNPRAGPWLFFPLVFVGVFSVTYWHVTEQAGQGDVRIYAFVQFFPLLLIPIILALFPARHFRTQDLAAILGWYVLAKLLEYFDRQIYTGTGFISGHTLKHIAASLGAFWVWVLLVGCVKRSADVRAGLTASAPTATEDSRARSASDA